MISANNVTLRIGKKALFEDVNIKFTDPVRKAGDDKGRRRNDAGTASVCP